MTRFVLASASSGRRKVLRQAGIEPLVLVSGVDEDAVMARLNSHASPGDVTSALASAKAEAVVGALDPAVAGDCAVMGCDSMLLRDGVLLGKPASADEARRGWQEMAGKHGRLFTGHCLVRVQNGAITDRFVECAATTVNFGVPSPRDLDAYVASGEPTSVAGGFTLDGLGGWFVDGVDGDPSAVIGISLPLTRRMLEKAGLTIPDLWAANPVIEGAPE